jgi:hypothetical protein
MMLVPRTPTVTFSRVLNHSRRKSARQRRLFDSTAAAVLAPTANALYLAIKRYVRRVAVLFWSILRLRICRCGARLCHTRRSRSLRRTMTCSGQGGRLRCKRDQHDNEKRSHLLFRGASLGSSKKRFGQQPLQMPLTILSTLESGASSARMASSPCSAGP